MFILKTLKNAPTCFGHHSDHLQGARMFLVLCAEVCRTQSGIPLHTERTYTHQMLCSRITTFTFYIFNKF